MGKAGGMLGKGSRGKEKGAPPKQVVGGGSELGRKWGVESLLLASPSGCFFQGKMSHRPQPQATRDPRPENHEPEPS